MMEQLPLMILALFLTWFAVNKQIYVLLIPVGLIFIYFATLTGEILLIGVFIAITIIVFGLIFFNTRE